MTVTKLDQSDPRKSFEADVRHHFHPMTNPKALESSGPMVVSSAKGIRVHIDGRQYLDMVSGMGCVNVGYGNDVICDAAAQAMRNLSYAHSFGGFTNPNVAALAEKLAGLTSGTFQRFFFASTGSDANESAVKIIYHYWRMRGQPKRRVLLSREHAYHGNTVVATSLTGIDHYHHQFGLPLLDLVRHVKTSYPYRDGVPEEKSAALAAESLEAMIREVGAENIAAFFVEPIQAAGGIIIPGAGYFHRIREICDKYDILLVADEVVTGFGKTGCMFAYQHFDFKPDLLVVAKGITSTYFPLSAVGLGKKMDFILSEANEDFEHGFTNCGHPVGAAVAMANIQVIEDGQLLQNVKDVLSPLISAWLGKMRMHPSVGDARSVGVLAALEFKAGASEAECTKFCELVCSEAYERGVIVRQIGPVLGLVVPMITTSVEMQEVLAALEESIEVTYSSAVTV